MEYRSSSTTEQARFEAYGYVPLEDGQMRVLHLKPGLFGSPLHVTLEVIEFWGGVSYRRQDDRSHTDEVASESEGEDQVSQVDSPHVAFVSYEAISYVWGPPVFPHALNLPDSSRLWITESLHSALQHFRYEDRTRTVWADAVCIDQSNLDERSQQVAIMGDIYRNAVDVLIWLGPSQPSDTLAFCTIRAVREIKELDENDFARDDWQSALSLLQDNLAAQKSCRCCDTPLKGLEDSVDLAISGLLAVAKLLERPWFSRMWVVQEAKSGLVKAMYSGSHHASFYSFLRILSLLDPVFEHARPRLPAALSGQLDYLWAFEQWNYLFETYWSYPESSIPFDWSYTLDILLSSVTRQCQDPRDRIFSIYSICQLDKLDELRPDYSMSVAEVYKRFLLGSLRYRVGSEALRLPQILALVSTVSSSSLDSDWPSWLPNLNSLTKDSIRKMNTYSKWRFGLDGDVYSLYKFQKADHMDQSCVDDTDPDSIRIRGKVFGEVVDILLDSAWPQLPTSCLDSEKFFPTSSFTEWYVRCRNFVQGSVDDEVSDARLMHVLQGGLTLSYSLQERLDTDRAQSLRNAFKDIWRDDEDTLETVIEDWIAFCLLGTETNLDTRRRLALVEIGDKVEMGSLPMSTRTGDRVLVVGGAELPFIVRERTDAKFEVLGDAYIPISLREALGGESVTHKILASSHTDINDERIISDEEERVLLDYKEYAAANMSWLADDPQMVRLIEGMEWIALR